MFVVVQHDGIHPTPARREIKLEQSSIACGIKVIQPWEMFL